MNPPKGAGLRALEGGTARRGAVSHRPAPPSVELSRDLVDVELEPPPSLGEHGREAWEQIVRPYAQLGFVTLGDLPACRLMCEAYQQFRAASEIVDREGIVAEGAAGQLRSHPAVRVADHASARFLALARELGATPASRVRLGLGEAKRRTLQHDLEERLGFNPRRTG